MKTQVALPLLGLSLVLAPLAAHGVVAEPDNVLYGSITLNNQPVTSGRVDVIVEARRTLSGPAIARYRMGSTLRLGNFYSLRIPVESAPVGSPEASQPGDNLVIVVSDLSGRRLDTTYRVIERGGVQRL